MEPRPKRTGIKTISLARGLKRVRALFRLPLLSLPITAPLLMYWRSRDMLQSRPPFVLAEDMLFISMVKK